MKKFTKFLAGACALALVGAMALGCNKQSDPEPTPASDPEPTPAEQHEAVQLQIFAANSLSKAMAEIQELYTKTHGWVTFADTQFKSSGDLNAMLEAGAYADIEITASNHFPR